MWLEVLAVILGCVYLVKYLYSSRTPTGVKPYNSIPGPQGWPVIGTFRDHIPGGK